MSRLTGCGLSGFNDDVVNEAVAGLPPVLGAKLHLGDGGEARGDHFAGI